MIALDSGAGVVRRFVDALHTTSPRAIPSPPDLRAYSDADIEVARLGWAGRIVDEYRSVAVFTELLGLLTNLEASYAALCTVHRLIGDELRHTQLTAMVVDWLGGSADLAIDLADVGLPPRGTGTTACERAQQIVARELVVVEQESIYALAAYRDATTDPSIRAVFELILIDEVRHAAAGHALYDELGRGAIGQASAAERARLERVIETDRAYLRSTYATSAVGGPGRALGASIGLADLHAIWARAARSS